jgi:Cu(I)/Ag(I) efflux system membrane protein CusA/SilA
MMTVATIMAGLLPIMWGTGTGSETMRRIAAPMVGGMVSATVLTLVVIPVVFEWVRGWQLGKVADHDPTDSQAAEASGENPN